MGINEDLRSFINKYRVEKGVKIFTNTSIGSPKVSLNIPDENYEEFINLYSLALTNGIPLYFTEKPLEPSPLRVDIDFRFTIPDDKSGIYSSQSSNSSLNNNKKYERLYDDNNIYKIVDSYFNIIAKYLNISDEDKIAYVMEKPNPVEFRNKLKDGLHIIFPYIIVNNNVHHFIRRKILDVATDIFKDLPICNDYDSIVDKAIIDVNCWQMYGSKKPDCDTYRVSSIYKYINNETVNTQYTLNAADEINFIKLFSMRNFSDNIQNFVKQEFDVEISQYCKHILPAIDQKLKSKLQNNIFGKSLNINRSYISDDEFSFAKNLVDCLSSSRADNYTDWINLGWVLRKDLVVITIFFLFIQINYH
jgi:hypothetical protein